MILTNPTWPNRAAFLRAMGIRRDRLASAYRRACLVRDMQKAAMIERALRATVNKILAA